LLESELFGHEKGAFTGADQRRIGKFEQCSGGTIFLDEIGDMSPLMQSKVLRVLQEQRFERVGGLSTIQTDVRIIAATNRDLEAMVKAGHFRDDLFFRINGFAIEVPPLRNRQRDIPLLIEHFLSMFARRMGKDVRAISEDALELLIRHPWPGNVRELQSALRQAILHTAGPVVLPAFLPPTIRQSHNRGDESGPPGDLTGFIDERIRAGTTELYAESLEHMERWLLTRILSETHGNQSTAAKILGITRGSLRNKLRAHGIKIGQTVNVDERHLERSIAAS
jgi:two-component system nitrogen regulation response regulator GlnG